MLAKLLVLVQFTTKTEPTPIIFWFWTRPASTQRRAGVGGSVGQHAGMLKSWPRPLLTPRRRDACCVAQGLAVPLPKPRRERKSPLAKRYVGFQPDRPSALGRQPDRPFVLVRSIGGTPATRPSLPSRSSRPRCSPSLVVVLGQDAENRIVVIQSAASPLLSSSKRRRARISRSIGSRLLSASWKWVFRSVRMAAELVLGSGHDG